MLAGELLDTVGFAGGKLLVPKPGAGDGFQNGLTARLCRDVRIGHLANLWIVMGTDLR